MSNISNKFSIANGITNLEYKPIPTPPIMPPYNDPHARGIYIPPNIVHPNPIPT